MKYNASKLSIKLVYIHIIRSIIKRIFLKKMLLISAGFLFLSIVFRIFIGEPYVISSPSMEPTLYNKDWIWVSKLEYGAKMPRRWSDIPLINVFTWSKVLYHMDNRNNWKYRRFSGYSKPHSGDLVVFESPENKNLLVVKRIEKVIYSNYRNKIKQNFYYMLGDNSEFSHDSRTYGYIPESSIIGKVSRVLFSTSDQKRFFKRVK